MSYELGARRQAEDIRYPALGCGGGLRPKRQVGQLATPSPSA
jgi:hypothetical protein